MVSATSTSSTPAFSPFEGRERVPRLATWRSWPVWRLLGVIALFAAIARCQFGHHLAELRQLPLGIVTVIEISLLLSLGSGLLGSAFVALFLCWPILAITRANNLFFDLGEWLARKLVSVARPRLLGAMAYAV